MRKIRWISVSVQYCLHQGTDFISAGIYQSRFGISEFWDLRSESGAWHLYTKFVLWQHELSRWDVLSANSVLKSVISPSFMFKADLAPFNLNKTQIDISAPQCFSSPLLTLAIVNTLTQKTPAWRIHGKMNNNNTTAHWVLLDYSYSTSSETESQALHDQILHNFQTSIIVLKSQSPIL